MTLSLNETNANSKPVTRRLRCMRLSKSFVAASTAAAFELGEYPSSDMSGSIGSVIEPDPSTTKTAS